MLCTRAGVVRPELTEVRSVHLPPDPVAICGGDVNDSRATARTPEGHACDAVTSPCPSVSLPLQRTLGLARCLPEPSSTSWLLSPASSSDTSRLLQFQNRPRAEVGRSGVMLVGDPPASGSVYTSPPVEPKSLIRPAMNATVLPSRDTFGSASC